MRKRMMKTKVLSYLLTLVMLLSSTMTVMAAGDPTVSGNQQRISEEVDETDETDSSVSENDSDITEETEEVSVEETMEATDVSANDQEEEGLFPGLPENYTFSAQELENKKTLQTELADLGDLREGTDYVAKEVIFLCDTEEEAQLYAAAFGATLESFFEGVGVITLHEKATVYQAVSAASKEENRLPAVEPNYYRYAFDTEEESPLEENYSISAASYNDPYLQPSAAGYQWHHAVVGSMYAWNLGYTGKGIKVAVLDTGVSVHEDLTITSSYNAMDNTTSDTADANSHGTHVAGIICAKNNNGKGGSGIAPDATLYNIRVLDGHTLKDENDKQHPNSGTSATFVRGMNKAIEYGVDIINMSIGGESFSSVENEVVKKATQKGITVIAAAGNESTNTKMYPAGYEDVIAVAATGSNNAQAYFSNFGAWVDLAAPGVDICSTTPADVNNGLIYDYKRGTSQATPVVSGIAAVVLSSDHPDLKDETGKALTGAARASALKRILVTNTIKAKGQKIGSGIPNLAKIYDLSSMSAAPNAPRLYVDGLESKGGTYTKSSVAITMKTEPGISLYYTVDGTTPTYKNGVVSGLQYTNGFSVDGIVKGKPTGKVTVKAIAVNTAGVVSKVSSITIVLKPIVDRIQISGLGQVVAGKSISLQASVSPAWAANKAVTWSISGTPKTTGVSINAKGVVTASKKAVSGTYTVTAQAKDAGAKTATYTIKVLEAPKVGSIVFNVKKVPVMEKEGTTTQNMSELLTVKDSSGNILPNAGTVVWSVNNTAVATINQSTGLLTAQGAGTVIVTAIAADGSGKKASIKVSVVQLPESISFTAASKQITMLAAGKSVTLKAEVGPAKTKNKTITWSITGDPATTGVNVKNGKVTATKTAQTGTYTVTAKSVNGRTVTQKISVVASSITKIALERKSVELFRVTGSQGLQTSTQIPIQLEGNNNPSALSVTSSAPGVAIASISNNTLTVTATGKTTGKATITIAAVDGSGKKAVCTVNVKNPASKLSIGIPAGRTDALAKGKSMQLEPVFETEYGPVTNKKLIWSSSNPSSVSVNAKGVVTAKTGYHGGAVITASMTDGSGLSASYIVYTENCIKKLCVGNSASNNIQGVIKISDCQEVIDKGYDYGLPVYMDGVNVGSWVGVYPEFRVDVSDTSILTARVKTNTDGEVYLAVYPTKTGTVDVKVSCMNGNKASAFIRITFVK